MKKTGFFIALALLLLSSLSAAAADLVLKGVSRPIYNAQLSFAIPGSVYSIAVKPGQLVKKGDLLMSLDSRPEDRRLELIEHEIENTIKIRTLETRIKQAKLDMQRYADALRSKAATKMESEHAALAHALSVLALEEEVFRIEQLKRSREELLAQRERMRLYAPYDGYVEDVGVELGMAVDKNVLALHLVSINPIQVELAMPVDMAVQIKEGDPVSVGMPGITGLLPGTVANIAKVAVLSNRTLRVRIHVENPDGLPVGLMADVHFPNIKNGGGQGVIPPDATPSGADAPPAKKSLQP